MESPPSGVILWMWICGLLSSLVLVMVTYTLGARNKVTREECDKCRSDVDEKIKDLIDAQSKMTVSIGELTGSFTTYMKLYLGLKGRRRDD